MKRLLSTCRCRTPPGCHLVARHDVRRGRWYSDGVEARGGRALLRAVASHSRDGPALSRLWSAGRRRDAGGAARAASRISKRRASWISTRRRRMRKDAIFRIASMSKPVTGVAIMMLMEEGKLRLTDPVSRFIPEFKEPEGRGAQAGLRRAPARRRASRRRSAEILHRSRRTREITIRDLLTHTIRARERRPRQSRGAPASRRADTSSDLGRPRCRNSAPGAARLPARLAVDLQPARRHGHARPDRRDRVGADLRSPS